MNKNVPTNNANYKLLEEASKKLKKIEKNQKDAERYFQERESNENKLKLLEANLKKKIKLEKRVSQGLEEKTIDKLQNLLKILANTDINFLTNLNNQNLEKINQSVQTDREDTTILKEKIINLEKENEKIILKKVKYKNELEILKSELETSKQYNEKLNKENKLLQNNLEEANVNKSIIYSRLIELEKYNVTLLENIKKNENILKEHEELKKQMEEKLNVEREIIEIEEEKRKNCIEKYRGNINIIIYLNLFNNVTSFLTSSDILNLKLCNRKIYKVIETNPNCQRNFYKSLVSSMKKKISELNSYDMKKDYLVNENEIERLMQDYVKSQKIPGKELKSSLAKAITFLNKEVKQPLGIKTVETVNPNISNQHNSGGYMSGLGSLIGGMFKGQASNTTANSSNSKNIINSSKTSTNPTPDKKSGFSTVNQSTSNSKNNSRGQSFALSNSTEISSEIEKYDKLLLQQSLLANTASDYYEFDYCKPDDIKNILNKFLKSDFSTDKLTAFIKSVCLGYSELLYFANKTIIEIRELDIVKNALNERYRKYHKLARILENEFSDAKQSMLTSGDKSNNFNDRDLFEDKYFATLIESNKLKEQCVVNELKVNMLKTKMDQISSEYNTFKIIFLKEIRNLKFDLDETTKQRNLLRDALIEFKNYFNIQIGI